MKTSLIFSPILLSLALALSACATSEALEPTKEHEQGHKIIASKPLKRDVINTEEYVCQIHARRHVEVQAFATGYIDEVKTQEGQVVKQGDVLFQIVPVIYQAKLDSETAEAELARIKYKNSKTLFERSIVSTQELALAKAELAKAEANVKLSQAELNFTTIKSPFNGIIDRQNKQQGSLVGEGDVLTTISDNAVMWVYFNVSEASYLAYKAEINKNEKLRIELRLANGTVFPYPGKIGAIEADFNNETGNIAFRADFPNPDGLLRHGQTGTILIHRKLHDAIVIPQRATYAILDKNYVYVIETHAKGDSKGGDDHTPRPQHHGTVRQRQIAVGEAMDDIFLVNSGLGMDDSFIYEGVRQVRDGDEVEYELHGPQTILSQLKFHAE